VYQLQYIFDVLH